MKALELIFVSFKKNAFSSNLFNIFKDLRITENFIIETKQKSEVR